MMIRRTYQYLMSLHPDHFRQQFSDELMSTFDDASRGRGSIRLLMDGFISLLRQRLFRRSPRALSAMTAGGPTPADLHERSERLQKWARLMNCVWVLSAFPLQFAAAWLMQPGTRTASASLFYTFFPSCLFIALYGVFSRISTDEAGQLLSRATRDETVKKLAARFESFKKWSDYMGLIMIFALLAFAGIALVGPWIGRAPNGSQWLWTNLIVFSIQTVLFFAVLKQLNERAAAALQQEMAARRK